MLKRKIYKLYKVLRLSNIKQHLWFLINLRVAGSVTFGKGCVVLNPKKILFGKNVEIGNNVRLQAESIFIGDNSFVGHNNNIYGTVNIDSWFMSGPNVSIIGGNHGTVTGVPMAKQDSNSVGIRISRDVWVGANSVVLDGAFIESGVVVGAGSVIKSAIKSNAVYFSEIAKYKHDRA